MVEKQFSRLLTLEALPHQWVALHHSPVLAVKNVEVHQPIRLVPVSLLMGPYNYMNVGLSLGLTPSMHSTAM